MNVIVTVVVLDDLVLPEERGPLKTGPPKISRFR